MLRYVWMILCVWMVACAPKVNGVQSRTIPMETMEAEAVLTLAQGHSGGVYGVEVLENGNLISYSGDGTLKIWNEDHLLIHSLEGHTDEIYGVEVLENGNLISYSADKTLRIWNGIDGTLMHTLQGHNSWVSGVELLSDGRIISYSGGYKCTCTLRMWSSDGKLLQTFEGHTDGINGVEILNNGNILSYSDDNTLRIWNTDGSLVHTLKGDNAYGIRGVRLLSGDRILSYSGRDNISQPVSLQIWSTKSGTLLHTLKGHTSWVNGIELLSDGRILSYSGDGTLKVWNPDTGSLIYTLKYIQKAWFGYPRVILLPKDRFISYSIGESPKIWDGKTGTLLRTLERPNYENESMIDLEVLPDGRIFAYCYYGTVLIWDSNTGELLNTFVIPEDSMHTGRGFQLKRMGDEKIITYAGKDDNIRIWDFNTGNLITVLEDYVKEIGRVEVLNHNLIVSSDKGSAWFPGRKEEDGKIRVWDFNTGRFLYNINMYVDGDALFYGYIKSIDNKIFYMSDLYETLKLYDEKTGSLLSQFDDVEPWNRGLEPLPDGRIISYSSNGNLYLWDKPNGTLINTFEGHTDAIQGVNLLENNKFLSHSSDKTLRIWSIDTGALLHTLKGHEKKINGVDVAKNGIILSYSDEKMNVWDSSSGTLLHSLNITKQYMNRGKILPNGRILSYNDSFLRIWSIDTGELLHTLKGHNGWIQGAEILKNGNILSYSRDGTLRIWNPDIGKQIHTLGRHTSGVNGVRFLSDNRLLSYGADGTFKQWNLDTGELIATSLITKDDQWAVFSPEGWFDGSKDFKGAHFVADNRHVIAFEQMREKFYQPDLLRRLNGEGKSLPELNKERFTVKIPPKVTAEVDESNRLNIDIENQTGGIGRVEVKINGMRVTPEGVRGHNLSKDASRGELIFDLHNQQKLKPGEENTLEVVVYNEDETIASRSISIPYTPSGTKQEASNLHVLSIGTGSYADETLDLRFAAKDAQDFAHAMKLVAKKELFPEHSIQLLSSGGDVEPTKANIRNAFSKLKDTRVNDVVVVFLAGHGTSVDLGQGTELYLYPTQEAHNLNSSFLLDKGNRETYTVTSKEIHRWMQDIPANKLVLILDTCDSGSAVSEWMTKRNLNTDQIRAIDNLNNASGMHILMGSAANKVSYEASQYGQGLLTYALLEGMQTGEGSEGDRNIWVQKLFQHAQKRVPQLAKDIGGIQQPMYQPPEQPPFPIGQIDETTKKSLVLKQVKPRMIRPRFHDREEDDDVLELESLFEAQLRAETEKGTLVFSDVRKAPKSCRVVGTYSIENTDIQLALKIRYEKKDVHAVTLDGSTEELPNLIKNMTNIAIETCPVESR